LEDIVLWGVLAVATSFATSASTAADEIARDIAPQITATFVYMALGLTAAPWLLKKLHNVHWNILIKASPVGYLFFILFIYAAVASASGVNLVFAAFLAGFGLVGGIDGAERSRFAESLESIAKVSFALFIPIYFAMVGYKLVLGRDFSPTMLGVFFIGSSLLALLSVGLAARLAGFRRLDIVNLAIASNARGGPGIVLASVAYDAGIINAQFYTTLVLTAVLTSQVAGAWLQFVLSRGWPLLSANSPMISYQSNVPVSETERSTR
jgi:Kef-type K+ transport system membrane component KefB